jgi:hypothetical protein
LRDGGAEQNKCLPPVAGCVGVYGSGLAFGDLELELEAGHASDLALIGDDAYEIQ